MANSKPPMSGTPDPSVSWQRGPLSSLNLQGKSAMVVGGTDGLGRAISHAMLAQGAEVWVVGRRNRDEGVAKLHFVQADLSSMRAARRLGQELPVENLDLLLLTTGIFAAPTRQVTEEGIERDIAVSYLCRYALLQGMGPRLGQARPAGSKRARVFVMGFPGTGERGTPDDLNAERSYDAMKVHMNTVAGNEMLVLDGVTRYPHLALFGLNPGLIKTGIRSNFLGDGSWRHRIAEAVIGLFYTSAEGYAQSITPLLFAPELEARSGLMFNQKAHAILPTEGLSPDYVARYMAASEALMARAVGA